MMAAVTPAWTSCMVRRKDSASKLCCSQRTLSRPGCRASRSTSVPLLWVGAPIQQVIQWFQNKSDLQNKVKTTCPSAGILILAFSVLAVQGGTAVWNIIALTVIFMVCLLLVFITWRQPESKTKLSFKV